MQVSGEEFAQAAEASEKDSREIISTGEVQVLAQSVEQRCNRTAMIAAGSVDDNRPRPREHQGEGA